MLELPEIEQVRRKMDQQWVGQRIRGVRVLRESWLTVSKQELEEGIIGRMLLYVERRGKALIFHLDDGRRLLLQIGFGGEVISLLGASAVDAADAGAENGEQELQDRIDKAQLVLTFDNGSWAVWGARTISLQWLAAKELDDQLKKWGPDPLGRSLSAEQFMRRFEKRRSALKTALTNPALLSGITPAVADEICYRAGILPNTKTEEMTEQDWHIVYESMLSWLNEAIEHPEMNLYAVSGHIGDACGRCGEIISELPIAGKPAAHCSQCQDEHARRLEPVVH